MTPDLRPAPLVLDRPSFAPQSERVLLAGGAPATVGSSPVFRAHRAPAHGEPPTGSISALPPHVQVQRSGARPTTPRRTWTRLLRALLRAPFTGRRTRAAEPGHRRGGELTVRRMFDSGIHHLR